MMTDEAPKLRIGGATRRTGYSRRTIWLAVERGELHPTRPSGLGGHHYFDVTELDKWVQKLKRNAK